MAPTRPFRVAYLMTHYPQLAQTFIAGEIAEIERRGIEIVPIAINPSSPTDLAAPGAAVEAARTLVLKQVSRLRLATDLVGAFVRRPSGFVRSLRAAPRGTVGLKPRAWRVFHFVESVLVLAHCRREGVRHIHAHFGGTTAAIARGAAELGNALDGSGWTWSFTIHGFQDFVNENENALADKAASATHVVCISDYTRSQLMRVSDPAHWHKYHVVRCGIDVDRFEYAPKAVLDDPPVIVLVGRISPEKGHLVLLDALQLLNDDGVKAIVEFIGYGPYEAPTRAHAEQLGVTHLTRFRGPVEPDRMHDAVAAADVFCLPSFAEGLPVSIMEAMAAGVAVVTTHISGIPELAVDEKTALLVPAGNAAELARALARIIGDDALRGRLVAAARARVVEQHTLARNADAIFDLLDRQRPR